MKKRIKVVVRPKAKHFVAAKPTDRQDYRSDSEVQQVVAFAAPEEGEHESPSDNEGEQLCGDQGQKR